MRNFLDECDYLIHLVRCAIHDLQPQELPDEMDFALVYELGKFHHVANIAFHSVEKLVKKPEEKLYCKWQTCANVAIVLDINQNYAAQQIRDAMAAAGIPLLEVQGTKIKPLYPQPEWRTMSDIDFIVKPEDLPKTKEILERLGYTCEYIYDCELDAYRSPNIHVEMHTDYFLNNCEYCKVMYSPFASVDEKGQHDINGFYLYNILHIAKHYFYGGCGIRRVLDVYYLNQKYGTLLNRNHVQKVLKRANAAEFAADFGRIADAWFSKEEQSCPRSEMERYIFSSGLHGTSSHEVQHRLERSVDRSKRFPRLQYFLRRFFGTTEILKTRYPILERYKILYPVCWIHRIFCSLMPGSFKRIRAEVKVVKKIDTKEE